MKGRKVRTSGDWQPPFRDGEKESDFTVISGPCVLRTETGNDKPLEHISSFGVQGVWGRGTFTSPPEPESPLLCLLRNLCANRLKAEAESPFPGTCAALVTQV